MTVEKAKKAMDAGLNVLKFSLDAIYEKRYKKFVKDTLKNQLIK